MEGNHKERPPIESADGDKARAPPPRLSRLEKPPAFLHGRGLFLYPRSISTSYEGSRITKLLQVFQRATMVVPPVAPFNRLN
jgi:hypothetical protein